MAGKAGKRWIIKNEDGLLKGPFSTEDILKRISRGDYTGDELISEYPGANWYRISKDPHFYDRLLEVLSGQVKPSAYEQKQNPVSEDTIPPDSGDSDSEAPAEKTVIHHEAEVPPPAANGDEMQNDFDPTVDLELEQFTINNDGRRKSEKHTNQDRQAAADQKIDQKREKTSSGRADSSPKKEERRSKDRSKSQSNTSGNEKNRRRRSRHEKNNDDIELVDVRKRVKEELVKGAWKPILAAVAVLCVGLYLFMMEDGPGQEERIHLLAPQVGKSNLSPEQAKARIGRGATEYLRDTFTGYQKAQNELVQVVEGTTGNGEVLALLCLTYYELWPFAYQDSADARVISQVTQAASAVDGAGQHAATCKVVDLLLKGRYGEARSLSNSVLEAKTSETQTPIPFYYFMAILSDANQDPRGAVGFLSSAQGLWPQWLKVFVYQAQLYAKLENYTEAARIYRDILKAAPAHQVAKIELGLIEYKQFRNLDRGAEMIRAGLQSSDKVQRKILSRGYLGLAEIYLQRHANGEALSNARRAYEMDSTNSVAKNLVIQLGGASEIGKTRFKAYQLIAEGDQFYREGDCNTAQAHYKTAYEIDKKSAQAAMKASECLWKLSLSTEAIEWMNKAIRADPKMIEAYVTLADYYSQRYNFVSAAQVLLSAQRVAPKSYEVFRGFAMVELRRNNLKSAVDYAKQALAIYDTDVESHVIMSEALIEMGRFEEGFAHATRARELDPNHRRAQAAFGRSLGGAKGSEAAVDYFNELVKTYPLVSEYRLALGKQLMADERYGEAERVFKELTGVDEKSKEAFLQLGKAQRMQNEYAVALQSYDQAAILDPSDAEPLFQAASLYLEINKPVDAQVQLQRVLRINKLYPLVHFNLGRAALMLGDAAGALKEAKEERNINPNLADAYLLAADAYTAQQQYSLCVGEYQKAIKLRPQSAPIYIKMAVCYRKADQLDVAISMLNQAAVQESGVPDIYRELGTIYEIKGEMNEAAKAYQQYFVLNPNAPDRGAIEKRFQALGKGGR